jgi:Trk K+ transport system NAD-binding subunit/nucleotide-binding universal stress UspA family protein
MIEIWLIQFLFIRPETERFSMIVVIGAGNIGRELLAKLSPDFEVTCVDSRPDAESVVASIRGKERTRVIIGDATSRLVLEKAMVEESEVVLITTTTEKINLEVARVLHDRFNVRRVISVGITDSGMKELAELGAEVKSIFTASANDIRNLIEHQAKTAHGIGIGRNEILEVEVHPASRLRDRPLGYIAPIRWNIGIIYRDGNIIVPKPETVLKEKDRVVVLGDPAVLKTVAELLSSEFERFPFEFGTSLAVYLTGAEDEGFFGEVNYLSSVFQLDKAHFVYSSKAEPLIDRHNAIMEKYNFSEVNRVVSSLSPAEALKSLAAAGARIGIVIADKKLFFKRQMPLYAASPKLFLSSFVRAVRCPVILSGGTQPYAKLLLPALIDFDFRSLLDKSIEISHTITADLSVVTAKPSEYIGTEEDSQRFEEAKKAISDIGFAHRKIIDLQVCSGNPVQEIARRLPQYSLLILGSDSWTAKGFFRSLLAPDVAWQILRRAGISTLILPGAEETL